MKKITLLAMCFALLPACAFAQPEINLSNVDFNFTGEFHWTLVDNFDPGPAGANQTWDFSDLDLSLIGTDTSMPVAGSPYASQFPTANYLYKFQGMGGTRYYYHNITSEKYEILSLAYAGDLGWDYTPNPRKWLQFPYTFGLVFTDTFQSTDDEIETLATLTYDAYGTLILPFGTFANVVRQKVVTNGQINYNWFNVQPFYPLLQTVLEENSVGVVKKTTLGLDDTGKQKFALWPNPVNNVLNISHENTINQHVTFTIYDVLGKKVLQKELDLANQTQSQLVLGNQTPGLYMVIISGENGKKLFSGKIIKQ